MNLLRTVFQGILIGSSMLIPGLSGGTMAIIIGIYDDLIHAISHLKENWKHHLFFLLQFLIGAILGVLLFARPVLFVLETFQASVTCFFIGIIIGSVPSLYRKAKISKWHSSHFIFAAGGFLLAYSVRFLPKNLLSGNTLPIYIQFLLLFFAGIIISVALILPGISTSHMLLLLGLYESVLNAFHQLDFLFLLPLFIGTVIGILSITRGLESLMTHFPQQTYCTIIGFVLSSVFELVPPPPQGLERWSSIAMFLIGMIGTLLITKRFQVKEKI